MRVSVAAVLVLFATAASFLLIGGSSRGNRTSLRFEGRSGGREAARAGPEIFKGVELERPLVESAKQRELQAERPLAQSLADRVTNSVASLAAELKPETYDATRWVTHLRAAVNSLGLEAAGDLRVLAAGPGLSMRERVAACELLRVLRASVAGETQCVDASVVTELRRECHARAPDERSVPVAVCARSLAAWGDDLDHQYLVDIALGRIDAPESGNAMPSPSDALAALAHSGSALVAHRLADECDASSLVALDAFERHSGWCLNPTDRLSIAERIDAHLRDSERPDGERLRAIASLRRFDAGFAQSRFVALLNDPSTSSRVVHEVAKRLARDPANVEQLLTALAAADDDNTLVLATALAPAIAAPAERALRDRVLGMLEQTALHDEVPNRRVRAIRALGTLGGSDAFRALSSALRHDPDNTVRIFAAVALRAHPDASGELLTMAAESDPSSTVRDLCLRELDRAQRCD